MRGIPYRTCVLKIRSYDGEVESKQGGRIRVPIKLTVDQINKFSCLIADSEYVRLPQQISNTKVFIGGNLRQDCSI